MVKIFPVQNVQEIAAKKEEKKAKILGHMARMSQKFMMIFTKKLIRNTTLCGNSSNT